jgi:hypothetical protein
MLISISALTALYQNRLESDAILRIDRPLYKTPAFLALESVMAMTHDIVQMLISDTGVEGPRPVSLPGIISLYTVGTAAFNLSTMYPRYASILDDIRKVLKILGRRWKLAGRAYFRTRILPALIFFLQRCIFRETATKRTLLNLQVYENEILIDCRG